LASSVSKIIQVFPQPGFMFGVLGLVERFLLQDFVLLAELRRALQEAVMLLGRCSRRVPHVLTVRTQEAPLRRVLVGENSLGPAARRALDMKDVSEPSNRHGSILRARAARALFQSEQL
jgi:hypothetical protein